MCQDAFGRLPGVAWYISTTDHPSEQLLSDRGVIADRIDETAMDAFLGIDVAFAKRKRLPVAAVRWDADVLMPWSLAEHNAPAPPRGCGNVAALDDTLLAGFADDVVTYLRELEHHFGFRIQRIGIDAPSDPRPDGVARRKAEIALDGRRISCFTTPSVSQFKMIRRKVNEHLAAGGAEARLPHANQLWMLVGFALFNRLRRSWECLEVFPQATASLLGASAVHKTEPRGLAAQISAASRHTRWPAGEFQRNPFRGYVWGPAHDGLDAYMAAWMAALEPPGRKALGAPPNDAIWVPNLGAST